MGYGVYSQVTKKSAKASRIPCQTKSITFEKVNDKKLLKEAQKLFLSRSYNLKSDVLYSKYMNSHLINILSKEEYKKLILTSIIEHTTNKIPQNKKLLINTYLYENDKEDKGKKSKKAKLYAGYVVVEFKLDRKSIYKIQVDYMDTDTKDLQNRIDCAIQSFITL